MIAKTRIGFTSILDASYSYAGHFGFLQLFRVVIVGWWQTETLVQPATNDSSTCIGTFPQLAGTSLRLVKRSSSGRTI